MSPALVTKSSCRSFGSPTAGRRIPPVPTGITSAETDTEPSVISVTWAVPDATPVTFPIRPSPVMTGWSTRIPSPRPLSTWMVEYQSVGEMAKKNRASIRFPSWGSMD